MPLGLAKDSMINLAELAHQKEDSEISTSDKSQNNASPAEPILTAFAPSSKGVIPVEENEEKEKETLLVMRLSTHEIGTLDLEAAVGAAAQAAKRDGSDKESPQGLDVEQDPAADQEQVDSDAHRQASTTNGVSAKARDKDSIPLSIGDGSSGEMDDSLNSDMASQLGQKAEASQKAETASTATVNNASYGSYAGFSADYSEYDNYNDLYASYSGTPSIFLGKENGQNKQSQQPFWCCLFPWITYTKPDHGNDSFDDDATSSSRNNSNAAGEESMMAIEKGSTRSASGSVPSSRSGSKDEDEYSTGSDAFGEKLSEKDRQAVLARLRLAQPDEATGPSSPSTGGGEGAGAGGGGADPTSKKPTKGLINGLVPQTKGEKKGILKRSSTVSSRNNLKDSAASLSGNNSADGNAKRRSLFPSYETTTKAKKNLSVDFSPMARVLTVKSHKDMDHEEKSRIWWQRSNYEEFRKTGRMITKAMLEGGSEIWLATNQSWLLPNKDKQSTLKHAYSLAEQQAAFQKGDMTAKEEHEETRDKWWHIFGHSRRGLEHVASIDEGRQRQANVRTAIRAVIDEQRRQKVFHREDPDKLRMVSIQHTSWARDLAMAAGASDADAVQVNFDDESRKSREFYLLKFSRSNEMKVHTTAKASVPAFMKPALALQTAQPGRLDAHTVPQIRYRQAVNKKLASAAPAPSTEKSESIPIKSGDDTSSSKMAKQAAGFASGEEVGNMSNVLTGMGAIPVAGGS